MLGVLPIGRMLLVKECRHAKQLRKKFNFKGRFQFKAVIIVIHCDTMGIGYVLKLQKGNISETEDNINASFVSCLVTNSSGTMRKKGVSTLPHTVIFSAFLSDKQTQPQLFYHVQLSSPVMSLMMEYVLGMTSKTNTKIFGKS
jgi:hypothetical protein